ncbi:MAG TPA: zinc-binding dehydrogenase, partial [Chthonomonadales bacterium]|nr:zinc-binding dehydrogenase [Chthonomonadales bacterium]
PACPGRQAGDGQKLSAGRRSIEQVRAAVIPAPHRPVEVRRYPMPVVEQGGVLLRVLAAEVCGTDVHLSHGRLPETPYPLIPGHVSAGVVEEKGGELSYVDGSPVAVGDVVTFLDVYGTCGACWYCLVARASTRCPNRKVYGITVGAEESPGLSGGWAERLYLRPGTRLIRLPNPVDPELFIGAGCGLPTALHAIDLANIRLGDRVLIHGSGPVGLSAAALARFSGAGWVGVIGAPAARLEAAKRMGADSAWNIQETSASERLSAVRNCAGGRGPDTVIEASGNPDAIREGCELVRDAGRYVVVGQYTDNGDVKLNPHRHINKKHLEVRGCWGSDFSHVYRSVELLARFPGDWRSLITRSYSLEQAGAAISDVEALRVVKAVIIPTPD